MAMMEEEYVGVKAGEEGIDDAVARLASAIGRLGEIVTGFDRESRTRDDALRLEVRQMTARLNSTATDARLAEFRGAMLADSKLLNEKIDLLLDRSR